jgi:hypothetical protein
MLMEIRHVKKTLKLWGSGGPDLVVGTRDSGLGYSPMRYQ